MKDIVFFDSMETGQYWRKKPSKKQKQKKQESVPVGCVPTACADHTCFNSHQMSVLVAWILEVNKFEQVSCDDHQMLLAGGREGVGRGPVQ